jgi:WD40 repeat-containing protein SMU1
LVEEDIGCCCCFFFFHEKTKAQIMSSRQIESADVIRLIVQFLDENRLHRARDALLAEANVAHYAPSSTAPDAATAQLVADVRSGRCMQQQQIVFFCFDFFVFVLFLGDSVLPTVAHASLEPETRTELYEQIALELIESNDAEAATALLQHAAPLKHAPRRALLLELVGTAVFDAAHAYQVDSIAAAVAEKNRRRKALSKALSRQVRFAPPQRLLALLSQALHWQQFRGLLPPGNQPYDLFADVAVAGAETSGNKSDVAAAVASRPANFVASDLAATVKFGKSSTPLCAVFSPDGESLATGGSDGFVELWHAHTGKLRRDLAYQANDDILMHDCAVLCVAFSIDSLMVASGDTNGQLKVWHVPTGQVVRRFERAHQLAVQRVAFLRDGTRLVTCSPDETVCVHGLQSGTTLKVLRGHSSFVNDVALLRDPQLVVSVGADGSVRVWDLRVSQCTSSFQLRDETRGIASPIASVCVVPNTDDHLLMCNRTPSLFLTTLAGRVLRTFQFESAQDEIFVACAIGLHDNKYAYGVSDRGNLYSFELASGKLQRKVVVHDGECIGVSQHPRDVLVATLARNDRKLKLWN